jgi:hypothetical protein
MNRFIKCITRGFFGDVYENAEIPYVPEENLGAPRGRDYDHRDPQPDNVNYPTLRRSNRTPPPKLKIVPVCEPEIHLHTYRRPNDEDINCSVCFRRDILLQCLHCTTAVCPDCYRSCVVPHI